jgi:hypothetical protein
MPSTMLLQIELQSRFDLILLAITDILDDLFFMRLELEAGGMPDFSTNVVFDPMRTIGKYE